MIQTLQQHLNLSSQQRLLLMLAILCLTLLALPSSGFVRYGNGGEEDEGSGIGGTGRYSIPGSDSGLGGTGYRPYIGYSQLPEATDSEDPATVIAEPRELTIYHDPAHQALAVSKSLELNLPPVKPVTASPLSAPGRVAVQDDYVKDSSPILISEQIQRDLEADALFYSQLETSLVAQENPATSGQLPGSASSALDDSTDEAVDTENSDQVSWQTLASFLMDSEQQTEQGKQTFAALASDNEEPHQRTERPDRLQRPELPPMQRVRPIQRAGVLPPRVKPLSL